MAPTTAGQPRSYDGTQSPKPVPATKARRVPSTLPSQPDRSTGSDLRIGIVHARWNPNIINPLVEGAKKSLKEAGVKEQNIVVQNVPGSYELPFAVQR